MPPETALLDLLPKALWPDLAWSFALQLEGDKPENAIRRILEEAQRIKPANVGTWQRCYAARKANRAISSKLHRKSGAQGE